jgi:exo-beta-1,3-glucanase (GH17 family)
MRKTLLSVISLVLFSTLFASATRADDKNEAVVTKLQMRDKIVLIKNQASGIKYSVKSQDGTVLSANLTEAELASKHPDLYEKVRPSVAFPDGSSFDGAWAGTHLPN